MEKFQVPLYLICTFLSSSDPNVSLPSAIIENFYLSRHSKVINLKQKRRLPMSSLVNNVFKHYIMNALYKRHLHIEF